MRYLALEHDRDGRDGSPPPALLREEAAAVWQLCQAGVIRDIAFRVERDAAVVTLECRDTLEAERALASLPLVRAGWIGFELIPLRPYPGLARLFTPEATVSGETP